jgi:large subunit ribosomal protein L9
MKVLLLKDVYKLGHAGDVKKVADGYGRNYLLSQRLAVLATPGALKQAEALRQNAAVVRARLNDELGKLYGSITPAMIAEEIKRATSLEVDRRNVGHQPLRELGEYKVPVRLTTELIPSVKVIIYREGEALKAAATAAEAPAPSGAPAQAEAEAVSAEAEAATPAAE